MTTHGTLLIRGLALCGAGLLQLSGCAHPSAEGDALRTPVGPGATMAMCPMNVPGTRVSSTPVLNGEALAFTTSGDAVELRRRVHAMAGLHVLRVDSANGQDLMGRGMMGGMMATGTAMDGTTMPPSSAIVADLPDGASILLTPELPADLQQLRSAVRRSVIRMQQEGCGMMGQTRHHVEREIRSWRT